MKKNVLVTSGNIGMENIRRLSKVSNVCTSWSMDEKAVEAVLPDIDVLVVFTWPKFLTPEKLAKMKRMRFLQSILVGVNHVPFPELGEKVLVSSNAGGYSLEVGEHAFALLLAAAKKVVYHDAKIKGGTKVMAEFSGEANGIVVLDSKVLGVVGYGGIGREVAKYTKAFNMSVLAFTRKKERASGVELLHGRKGLESLLKRSDVVLLSLPLTNSTKGLIGAEELSIMKKEAILVNVARGDLVDEGALYSHLKSNPGFKYATDVWWYREGRETLETSYPFDSLTNFVGTPHMSGPTGVQSGKPGGLATDNVLRYLRGEVPRHLVDRSEYT